LKRKNSLLFSWRSTKPILPAPLYNSFSKKTRLAGEIKSPTVSD
jgi:hypothetical protein